MTLLLRLLGLVAAVGLLALTLPGCAGSADVATALSQPVDTTIQRQVRHQFSARRVKIKGPVTIQVGNGNSNMDGHQAKAPVAGGGSQAQDYGKAGQHGGAVATAPGASAGATTRTGVPPWALVAGAVVLLLLALAALAYQLRSWLLPGKR